MELSRNQVDFGYKVLQEAAERWNVDEKTAVKILLDIEWIKEKYNWVNLDMFLGSIEN